MSTYSNLKIEEITLGDSGWGTSTTNNLLAIQQALQSATLATGDFTSNVATLPWTNTSATTNTPRAMVLNITATLTGAGTVNLPAITGGKAYLVINNSGYAVTVKVTGLTGISVPNGKAMWLWNNGTDVVDGVNYISSLALGAALPLTSGGTGQTTANAAFNALAPSQSSASGKYLKSDGTNTSWDQIDISTADITGTLPLANGGTGQTTANAAFNALAPSQASASGKYLKSDGTNTSWDQIDISTADITGTLPLANGGTNATTASGARTNLGLGTMATQDASAVAVTGGTVSGTRINSRVVSYSGAATTLTWNADTTDIFEFDCLSFAGPITISNPTAGTPVNGQKVIFKIRTIYGAYSINYGAAYRGSTDLALPTATTNATWCYLGFIYNTTGSYWDLLAKNFGF